MAGMFYTLIEVAEKLGKTEDQIRQMVQDGQLREFRDGPKLLFKKDEVDAIAGQGGVPEDTLGLEDSGEGSTFGLASEADISDVEGVQETDENMGADDEIDLELDASGLDLALGGSDIDLDLAASRADDEIDLGGDTDVEENEQPKDSKQPESDQELELSPADSVSESDQTEEPQFLEPNSEDDQKDEADLSLSPEDTSEEDDQFAPALEDSGDLELGDMQLADIEDTGDDFGEIDLSDTSDSEGTKAETEGIQVLGEEDSGYKLTDDTLGETTEVTLESDEPSLDDDVNLESFGSGSGLLDLSLQADDTSLGAVLDDIIPGAGGSEDAGIGVPEDGDMLSEAAGGIEEPEPVAAVDDAGAFEDLGQAADSQPQAPVGTTAMVYSEAPADGSSNIFGALLLIPLLVSIFTIIISLSGASSIAPGLLTATQGIIWFVAGGLVVVSLIWMFVGIAAGAGKSSGKPKKSKAKKTAKPKKEKKPKKVKAAKPKKEKKKKK